MLIANHLQCKKQENVLFSNLTFQLNAGEMLVVEGSNGSGKSSLLRLLTGLATPSQGDILWDNESISFQLAEYQQHLHYVGHANGLRLDLTVSENMGSPHPSLLEELGLEKHPATFTRFLSAGQQRKVALAKLLIAQKKLWLLDEPLTALDAKTQTFFITKLRQHLQNGGMAVVSSHHAIVLKDINMQIINL